jgi:hypothetical protein
MENYLPNLQSIASLVPEQEFDEAWQLVNGLLGLERISGEFITAVELFEFSGTEFQRSRDTREGERAESGFYDYALWKDQSQRFSGWRHIAARDGAMQIYHFGTTMTKIRGQLYKIPTILPLIDVKTLKSAVKNFTAKFPLYVLIRNAVAHSIYELAPSAAAFRAHAPDDLNVPGLAKGRGIFITHCLYGDRFMITKDKQIAEYTISRATHSEIELVREEFVSGFDRARSEVAKDWPKPPAWWKTAIGQ